MLSTPVARLSGTHDGALPSTRDPAAVTAAYLARALRDPQGLRAVRRDRAGVAFRSPGIGGLRFLRRPELRRARSRDGNPLSCWRKNHPACGGHVDCDRSAWPTALAAAAKIYGPSFNPQITLKALSYFDDGNLRDLAEAMKLRLVTAARETDLDHLPGIESTGRDFGHEL